MMPRSGSRFEGRLDGWRSPGHCATVCYMATSSTVPARKRAAKRPVRPASAKSRAAAAPSSTPPVEVARTVHPVTVGVRELRQNLSVYLDRVKQGVAMQVTEHGRVVALLTPIPATASRYDILLAQGLIVPATRSILSLPAPRPLPPGARPISEILEEMRSEERY